MDSLNQASKHFSLTLHVKFAILYTMAPKQLSAVYNLIKHSLIFIISSRHIPRIRWLS